MKLGSFKHSVMKGGNTLMYFIVSIVYCFVTEAQKMNTTLSESEGESQVNLKDTKDVLTKFYFS